MEERRCALRGKDNPRRSKAAIFVPGPRQEPRESSRAREKGERRIKGRGRQEFSLFESFSPSRRLNTVGVKNFSEEYERDGERRREEKGIREMKERRRKNKTERERERGRGIGSRRKEVRELLN